MGLSEIIQIILQAEDRASQVIKQNEKNMKKLGDTAKQANDKASRSTQQVQQKMGLTGKEINSLTVKLRQVGENGKSSFDKLSKSEQDSLIKFNMLDKSSQKLLQQVNKVGNANFSGLTGAINDVKNNFQSLDGVTKTWSGSLDYSRSKLQLLGTDTDSWKGKIQVAGNAVQTYLGSKWDIVKTKVSSVSDTIINKLSNSANIIKSKFSSAITSVKNEVQSLGDKFSGIAGLASSVFGGIALNQLSDMTIGASIARDRIQSLSLALLGGGQSMEEFTKKGSGLWDKMDQDTNKSLVSLDQLSQSLSVVKQMTGATGDDLLAFEDILLDVGQRAILMGKDGTEAMSLMQASGKGLNGEFEMLKENFGITRDKLIELGWSGAADDIDGYTAALQEALDQSGDVSEMMNTTYGKLTSLNTMWKVAGRSLGDVFKPYLDQALDSLLKFLDADKDGALDDGGKKWLQYAYGAMAVASGFATLAPSIAPVLSILDHVNFSILTSPWMWLVGVLALVAVSAYEVGKSFGWWTDITSMMDAITDGVRRLWEAFSNSPVVQEAISSLRTDFVNLLNSLKEIGTSLLSYFDFPEENFDIVHSIVTFFTENAPAIQQEIQDIRSEAYELGSILKEIALAILPYIPGIVQTVKGFFDTWGGTILKVVKYALLLKLAFKGYSTIKSTIQTIKDKFKSLKDDIKSAKDKIVDFKNRLKGISDGNKIDALKNKLKGVKDALLSAKGKVIEFVGNIKKLAVAKVTALKEAFLKLAESINLAAIKEKLYAVWQGIVNGVTAIWNALLAMNPIMWVVIAVVALVAVLIYLYNTNETVRNAINGLWEILQGVGSFIMSSLVPVWNALVTALQPVIDAIVSVLSPALQGIIALLSGDTSGAVSLFSQAWTNLLSALQPVSDFLSSVFGPAWDMIVSVISTIWNTIQGVIGAFQLFANGQMDLPQLIMTIWSLVSNAYITIFNTIINFVISFASSMLNKAVSAGRGFFNGIINYIRQLPGRIASYLLNVVSRISSAGASWINTGISKASSMVKGIISHVQQLPGKVYTEFMNIGSRIMSAGSQLVEKAKQIGRNIVNGLLNAMGIHSPGIIQTKVVKEFVDMITGVGSKIKSAYNTAKAMGTAITDGFGNPTLEADVSNILPNTADLNTSINIQAQASPQAATVAMDSSSVDTGNAEVIGSYENLANVTGNALQQMIEKDKLAYSTIRNNDATELSNMTTNLQNKMSNMTNNVRTSMDAMVNKNKSGLNTVKNSTNTQLTSMVNKTKSANSKMIASWGVMKDGIVKAANKIKTDSTNHFNKLSKTIGSFYHKLENPGGFGAGPGTGRVSTVRPMRRSGSSGFSKITDAIRKARLPSYMSLSQLKSNPFVNMDDIGSYITPTGKTNRFNTSDLIRSGSIKIPIGLEDPKNKGAGSWTSGVGKHVQKIKDKSGNWGMKGPKIIGKYATSIGFKVKEFLDGTPKINFASFKKIAEDVFSQCHYEFYYDSNKYGNWMTAFQNGGMNCSDSSDAIIAMAHAMGLPASKVHGHWNQFGHYWANVAGHKMDTTGWMNQRNWTPAASHAGPAPKSFGFNDLIEFLKSFFDDSDDKGSGGLQSDGNSNTTVISGEFTMVHDFRNLPEGISAEDVAAIVEQSATNDNFIKKLVKNVNFQNWDLNEKDRLNKKNRRAGVI